MRERLRFRYTFTSSVCLYDQTSSSISHLTIQPLRLPHNWMVPDLLFFCTDVVAQVGSPCLNCAIARATCVPSWNVQCEPVSQQARLRSPKRYTMGLLAGDASRTERDAEAS